jgi:hypothetical protein
MASQGYINCSLLGASGGFAPPPPLCPPPGLCPGPTGGPSAPLDPQRNFQDFTFFQLSPMSGPTQLKMQFNYAILGPVPKIIKLRLETSLKSKASDWMKWRLVRCLRFETSLLF